MKNNNFQGQVIPINRDNVDTDLIIPKQYLKSIKKSGFGPFLFDSLRYTTTATLDSNSDRTEVSSFILNQTPYKKGTILIAKSNFGCGSSREHAVWAIQNYGINIVIAESFADIFTRNSYANGLLLICLDKNIITKIINDALSSDSYKIKVHLESNIITLPNEENISFTIDDSYKERILNNLDDIELTLQYKNKITEYENKIKQTKPWLFDNE
jgi:3-isopropylmalate/(R)-2-methylmalate dehydratase small subunit